MFGRKKKRELFVKSDVWSGLENQRTWVVGRVVSWNLRKQRGVLSEEAEIKSIGKKHAARYAVDWRELRTEYSVLKAGQRVWFELEARSTVRNVHTLEQ